MIPYATHEKSWSSGRFSDGHTNSFALLTYFSDFFPILNSFHSKIHKFMSLTMKKGVSQIILCRSNYYIDCDKLQNKNINKKPFRSMLISIYLRVCVRSHVDCTR